MPLSTWFLDAAERGNPSTSIDDRHGGLAWTVGNACSVLRDGAAYFARLHDALVSTAPGDWVHFTDWRGDFDERLAGPGTEVSTVLAGIARAGVEVRGLVWRSHPDRTHFSEEENADFAKPVNDGGGEVLLDERVRRAGSHHQKLFVVGHPANPSDDVAFIGGIDLCHGRHDDHRHLGDPQVNLIDGRYGPRPAWHDLQLEVRGPAVGDIAATFAERWSDPSPLDPGPWGRRLARRSNEPARPTPLRLSPPTPPPIGSHAVQVLRTYAARRPAYSFARDGERSIARAYFKAFARARRLIYIEDQYFWSADAAGALADALRQHQNLRVVVVLPRFPDADGRFVGPPNRISQHRALRTLRSAGGDRFAAYNLERLDGWPIYVHSKVCVVDDVWFTVGSDNFNRRSWTHDSEVSCAVLDDTLDGREPADPAGLGDGARALARNTRLLLWSEHLESDAVPLDPDEGFEALRQAADALDAWHQSGRVTSRPRGLLRHHRTDPVPWFAQPYSRLMYRFVNDPDGRPLRMLGRHAY